MCFFLFLFFIIIIIRDHGRVDKAKIEEIDENPYKVYAQLQIPRPTAQSLQRRINVYAVPQLRYLRRQMLSSNVSSYLSIARARTHGPHC